MPAKIKKLTDMEDMAEIVLPNTCVPTTASTTQLMAVVRRVIVRYTLLVEIRL